MKDKRTIFITGGHSTPAFAVLDELLSQNQYEIIWLGEKFNQRGSKNPSNEYKTVTEKYKLKHIIINSGKFIKPVNALGIIRFLIELFRFKLALIVSWYNVLKYRPILVLSFGGFTAVPVVIAASLLRVKSYTHEQTTVIGLANKIIGIFAKKIFITFPIEKSTGKMILTGNPLRKDIFEIRSNLTSEFDDTLPIIYVTGGNQGANAINKIIFELLPKLLDIANVIHQTGNSTVTNDFQKALEHKANLVPELKHRYIVKDFLGPDEIGEVMNKADVLVSRAGANTVCEILALKRFAILIPLPGSIGGEQEKNADLVAATGLALKLNQKDMTIEKLYDSITTILEHKSLKQDLKGRVFDEAQKDAEKYYKPDAASLIIKNIVA